MANNIVDPRSERCVSEGHKWKKTGRKKTLQVKGQPDVVTKEEKCMVCPATRYVQ